MKVTRSCRNVARILKGYVNKKCEKHFKWFPEAEDNETASLFDVLYAIEILELIDDDIVEITEAEE